jgi:hypothetical protein
MLRREGRDDGRGEEEGFLSLDTCVLDDKNLYEIDESAQIEQYE